MLKFNSFKLKSNQRYNYTRRQYKGNSEGNIYEFDSKFRKYKDATRTSKTPGSEMAGVPASETWPT